MRWFQGMVNRGGRNSWGVCQFRPADDPPAGRTGITREERHEPFLRTLQSHKESPLRRLAGLAVAIALGLACSVSRAGGPLANGYGTAGGQGGYGRAPGLPTWVVPPRPFPILIPSPTPHPYPRGDPQSDAHLHRRRFLVPYGEVGTGVSLPDSSSLPVPAWDQGGAAPPAGNWQVAPNQANGDPAGTDQAGDDGRRTRSARNRCPRTAHPAGQENAHAPELASLRLSPEQFDRRTGTISWPKALQGEASEAARQRLEQLAAAGRLDSPDAARDRSREIGKLTEEIKEQLKAQVRDLPPAEYVAARKFLDGLAGELRSQNAKADLVADSRP
jgi:hypothetical protein